MQSSDTLFRERILVVSRSLMICLSFCAFRIFWSKNLSSSAFSVSNLLLTSVPDNPSKLPSVPLSPFSPSFDSIVPEHSLLALPNLYSSALLPISCPLSNLPQIFTMLAYFDVYLMYAASNKCVTNIKYIRGEGNSTITVTPQMTKHPPKQVLYQNQYSRKDGETEKTYEQYNRQRGRLASPSFTMPSFSAMGGIG